MNWQRWGIVAAIIAAVAAVWALLRSGPATVTNTPNPSSGGVFPASGTGLAPQNYTVNPPVLQPASIVSLAGPADPYSNATGGQGPGQLNLYGPSYLTYNLGPQSALTKGKPPTSPMAPAKPESCGCETACAVPCKNNAQAVTEGQGAQCMATSRKRQIDSLEKKYPGLWERMQENLYESGVDPGDVLIYWQQRNSPTGLTNVDIGTARPGAPGGQDVSTAGNSRLWPGAVFTGKIGHA